MSVMTQSPWLVAIVLLPLLACGDAVSTTHHGDTPKSSELAGSPRHEACEDPFVQQLAEGARHWASAPLEAKDYGTGSSLFDLEWLFGTWMMAAMGLGQHAFLCPESAATDLAAMEIAIEKMLGPQGRAFDAKEWGSDIGERMGESRGSIAYLGYGGLPLALHRALVPSSRFAETEAAWMEAIARRFGDHLVETYPGEVYPVDNCAAIGALALHDRVTGEDHGALLTRAALAVERAIDPGTGMLIQRTDSKSKSQSAPRGSGSFLAAWFLRGVFVDGRPLPSSTLGVQPPMNLGARLYGSARDQLRGAVLGIYAMREYPEGWEGRGDIDSGPLIMGYSVSATGFAMGAAVASGDLETRDAILRTIRLGGPFAVNFVPGLASEGEEGATGSHLGDAILLAMRTADGLP